jgi:hypothetical protein
MSILKSLEKHSGYGYVISSYLSINFTRVYSSAVGGAVGQLRV